MTANTIRQQFMREFVGMEKYSRVQAWLIVGAYIAQMFAAIAFGAYLLSLGWSLAQGFGVGLTMLFLGTRLRGLNNIIHECTHNTFSAHRPDNARVGMVCAAILLTSFKDYRDEHLSHHAHLGDYDKDLDLQGIKDLGLHDPLTKSVLLRHLVTPLIFRHLPYYLNINLSGRDGRLAQVSKFGLLALVAAATFAAPLTVSLFVILPFVVVFSALNYWADCMDHAGLVPSDDDLVASRNVLAPGPIRWLFFPRNDCYHLVHHLFPQIPARHLIASHEVLLNDPSYSAKANAVRDGGKPKGVTTAA